MYVCSFSYNRSSVRTKKSGFEQLAKKTAGGFSQNRCLQAKPTFVRSSKITVRAASDSKEDGGGESAEDVVARLAAAEAEAAELRKMLDQAQADGVARERPVPAIKRVDGVGGRETIFNVGKDSKGNKSWLQEDDVAFFTGDGPSELAGGSGLSEEDQSTVNRRLLIAMGLLGAFAVASQIPESQTRAKPAKPLFFYLVPLYRIKALLPDLKTTVQNGDATGLQAALRIIEGNPNNIKENLKNAAACLDDDKDFERANKIAVDLLEYESQIDFFKYFDSVTSKVNERQVAFSSQSVQATERKLDEFLAVMPREQREAAMAQVQF